jgi:hypothetical protein
MRRAARRARMNRQEVVQEVADVFDRGFLVMLVFLSQWVH